MVQRLLFGSHIEINGIINAVIVKLIITYHDLLRANTVIAHGNNVFITMFNLNVVLNVLTLIMIAHKTIYQLNVILNVLTLIMIAHKTIYQLNVTKCVDINYGSA